MKVIITTIIILKIATNNSQHHLWRVRYERNEHKPIHIGKFQTNVHKYITYSTIQNSVYLTIVRHTQDLTSIKVRNIYVAHAIYLEQEYITRVLKRHSYYT